jgi:hypothetical protein
MTLGLTELIKEKKSEDQANETEKLRRRKRENEIEN